MDNTQTQGQTFSSGGFVPPQDIIGKCNEARALMLSWEKHIHELMLCPDLSDEATPATTPGEAKSNIMLAYRHMEDARMRIGKVIQAMSGGVSVYDKKA